MPQSLPVTEFPNRWAFARELLGNKRLISKAMLYDLLWAAVVGTLLVTATGGLAGVFAAGSVGAKAVALVQGWSWKPLFLWGLGWAVGFEDMAKAGARAAARTAAGAVNQQWEAIKRAVNEGMESKAREHQAKLERKSLQKPEREVAAEPKTARIAKAQADLKALAIKHLGVHANGKVPKLPANLLRRTAVPAAPPDARALYFKAVCDQLTQNHRLTAADYEYARQALRLAPQSSGKETAAARGYRLIATKVAAKEVRSAAVMRQLVATQKAVFEPTLAA